MFAFLALPLPAPACRCPAFPSPHAAYGRAHLVVAATVTNATPNAAQDQATATLRVSKGWKKKAPREISVSTSSSCAFAFTTGEEYLLYLFETSDGGYFTSKCVGNQPLREASRALKWLKEHGAATDPD
jgi:hypothetical protein